MMNPFKSHEEKLEVVGYMFYDIEANIKALSSLIERHELEHELEEYERVFINDMVLAVKKLDHNVRKRVKHEKN